MNIKVAAFTVSEKSSNTEMSLENHLEAKNTRFYKLIDKGESQFLRYENLLNLTHAGMQNAFFHKMQFRVNC